MLKTKIGKEIDLTRCREIAAGGEGKIFEHPTAKKKVVKLYHQLRPATFAAHLELLATLGTEFVRPGEVLYINGQVAGFEMNYVNFNDYWLFNNLFNKGFCNSNGVDSNFKNGVLVQLRSSLESLHAAGIVVGDLNQYNLFVSKAGKILFVDVDSYASKLQPHSGVLLDEIRDWTTQAINAQTDTWAYDILVFWTLTFCHPFKWVVPGNTETIEQRVRTGKSFLSKITGMKVPVLYQPPVGDLLKQFQDIFSGRRYFISITGAHIPVPVQVTQAVSSSSVMVRELYRNVMAVNSAFLYIAIQSAGRWKLVETAIAKVTREIKDMQCDELYPSATMDYAWRNGDTLHAVNGFSQNFAQPKFYFSNGFLAVFDYSTDQQWNFDIMKQIGSLDCTYTPVFTKSIIVRDSPIQNFGGSKYLNIPMQNRYTLVSVPFGIKNAVYYNGYIAIEYTNKRTTQYRIKLAVSDIGIDLDYLPWFTVKDGLVFLPDDGHIKVLKDFSMITSMDVPGCTRDSKLYVTASGILMLESNTLYLLNTK